jgi:RNA polymerase sporulation-specific sigma factor
LEKRAEFLNGVYPVGEKIDEEVVSEAKLGDVRAQEYLIAKYQNFVKAKAKSYFLIGADKEDIYQEGMISWLHSKLLQSFALPDK